MAISLSYHKLFTIGVDSLMMLKWSHATDITNMGQFNHYFFTVHASLTNQQQGYPIKTMQLSLVQS